MSNLSSTTLRETVSFELQCGLCTNCHVTKMLTLWLSVTKSPSEQVRKSNVTGEHGAEPPSIYSPRLQAFRDRYCWWDAFLLMWPTKLVDTRSSWRFHWEENNHTHLKKKNFINSSCLQEINDACCCVACQVVKTTCRLFSSVFIPYRSFMCIKVSKWLTMNTGMINNLSCLTLSFERFLHSNILQLYCMSKPLFHSTKSIFHFPRFPSWYGLCCWHGPKTTNK